MTHREEAATIDHCRRSQANQVPATIEYSTWRRAEITRLLSRVFEQAQARLYTWDRDPN